MATKVSPFMANYGRELRKGRKCNRICGKNEESIWENRSSIEEGIRKYEETGR